MLESKVGPYDLEKEGKHPHNLAGWLTKFALFKILMYLQILDQ